MSDTQDVTYTGPHLEVEVVDYETGFTATVAHGATVNVPVTVAASLLEQGPSNWVDPAAPPAEEDVADDTDEGQQGIAVPIPPKKKKGD